MTATRRLAAILAVDVAGYSRLMGEDEATLGAHGVYAQAKHRSGVARRLLAETPRQAA